MSALARRRVGGIAKIIKVEPPTGKVPPHDLDAEAAVLSAVMLSRDALDLVIDILRPEHFYSQANERIYMAAQELASSGTPIDIVSIASWLRGHDWLQHIGGPSYLAELADATPAVSHVTAHAKVVFEKWRLRQLADVTGGIWAECFQPRESVKDFIDTAEQAVYEVARVSQTRTARAVCDILKARMTQIAAAAARGERLTGFPTGYEKFDGKTAGLHDGDLIVIAARPGQGKTSLAMNIAVNVASPYEDPATKHYPEGHPGRVVLPGRGVFFASLEMPEEQVADRMLCCEGRVDLGRYRSGHLQPYDWERLTEAGAYLGTLPIRVDDTPALSLLELRAKVRRFQAEYNRPATATEPARRVGLVVVDYLQLMGSRGDEQNREQEVSKNSRGLKEFAKELGVPVIALSQLNRSVETRSTKDKRPQLSDLRESGAIEQDADIIVFIYRDEYYNPETTNAKGIAELIIAKQRNGPTGKVLVRFASSCTRFDNLAVGDYPEMEEL